MLLLQLAFCLEPIVQVVAVYATAFEVQFICSLLDFIQTQGGCELRLGRSDSAISRPSFPYLLPQLSLSF